MAREKRISEMATYQPVRDIDRVFDEIEETFEDVFGRPFYPVTYSREPEVRAWSPPMEIYDTDDAYTVRMELPGVKKEDIDISATGDSVTIRGERKEPEGAHDESYLLCERCYGAFERTVSFPTEIERDNISANYDNGVLELNVPKVAGATSKKIEIKSSSQPRLVSETQIGRQTLSHVQMPAETVVQGYPDEEFYPQEIAGEAPSQAIAIKIPDGDNGGALDELPGQTGDVGEENTVGQLRTRALREPGQGTRSSRRAGQKK